MNTHYGVVTSHEGAPRMTVIASGPEDHCRAALDAWTAENPLTVWEQAEVLLRVDGEPKGPSWWDRFATWLGLR